MARAQERPKHGAPLDQRPLPPAITYGKKRNRLIPLTGNHFIRPDPYDIPRDENDGLKAAPRRVGWGKVYSAKEPDPDDSPLSEDELDAVYGHDAYPKSSPPGLSPSVSDTSPEGHPGLAVRSVTPPRRRQIPQPTPRVKCVVESSTEPSSTASDIVVNTHARRRRIIPQTTPPTSHVVVNKKGTAKSTHRVCSAVPSSSTTPAASTTPADTFSSKTTKATSRKRQIPKSAPRVDIRPALQRLPVNELLLVRSPSEAPPAVTTSNSSSPQDEEPHDPIEPSSIAIKRRASAISDDEEPRVKAPLTSIRKRLKKPMFTHKSVVALRKKHQARSPCFKIGGKTTRLGDGFETAELKISHTATTKKRRACKPLTQGLSALTLKSGPLPEVEFTTSSLEFQTGSSRDDDSFLADNEPAMPGEGLLELTGPAEHPERRTMDFSDRVLDEMVAKRLSSISAPKRVYSISSDDDEDDENEEGDSDEEAGELVGVQEVEARKTQSISRPTPKNSDISSHSNPKQVSTHSLLTSEPPRNAGVMLDFRKPITPGMTSKRPFSQRHLIEVDETIIDEPHAESWPMPGQTDDHEISEPAVRITRFADQDTPVRSHRPRSILRRNTPLVQESDTRPEHTAANTRRNSARVTAENLYFPAAANGQGDETKENEVDELSSPAGEAEHGKHNKEIVLDESRYFSNATGVFRDHQAHRGPRIIKQRSSEARRASYFSQPEVQVPGSDAAVLETSTAVRETSLDPPDYTNFSKLDVLKRTSDAWTSSVPRLSRDLKTLTRTVSKEHGTLSQSARRRPSLPFQSPVKGGKESRVL